MAIKGLGVATNDAQRLAVSRGCTHLLDEGVGAKLDERWEAIVAASVALTTLPITFGPPHIERLRQVGLDDAAIADLIGAASFFNWANRLMLNLGEAVVPGG